MRIGLIASDLTQPGMRGLARYASGLATALARHGAEIVLFSRDPLDPRFADVPGERCVYRGRREVLWEQWDLPRLASRKSVDVLHAPSNRGLCAVASCPTVLTRHDAIERLFPPDYPGGLRSTFRMYYSDEISVRCASKIATISEVSKRDILSVWGVPEHRVAVAGEGIDDRFFEPVTASAANEVRSRYALPNPYVFYLGGFDSRKQVETLIEGFARWGRAGVDCVIGGSFRGAFAKARDTAARLGLENRIRFLGEVSDADVPALYAAAACFVYPSKYEGFGLQAAEAMAARVPLIVSDAGALPEVAGEAALKFESGNPEALAACLSRIFDDPRLRESLIERGAIQAERYRWASVVEKYIDLYRRLDS